MKLKKEKAIALLTAMVKGRIFDEKVMELFTLGNIPGFVHVGIGQEAVAAGICCNLKVTDYISITHRGHNQAVAKGIDLKGAMAELFGKKTGLCKGKSGSMHLAQRDVGIMGASGIVGAGLPIATGAALSARYRGTDQVTACFFGDGAVNEGTFHESLNMASLWNLPVVYCCENNGWAQFTPMETTTKVIDVATRAKAYGMPGITVDGTDVVAVSEAAERAIERARKGEGPTLLECKLRRLYGHYVGDPQKYRAPEDIEETRKADPIARFESRLIDKKLLTAGEIEEIKKRANAEIAEAIEYAKESPLPEPQEALEDVYLEGGAG